MSTVNFGSKCGKYFVIDLRDLEERGDYDMCDERVSDVKEVVLRVLKDTIKDADVLSPSDYVSETAAAYVERGSQEIARISETFVCGQGYYDFLNLNIACVLRAGYYSSANLDWEIHVNGSDYAYSDVKDIVNDNSDILTEDIQKEIIEWVNKTIGTIEKVYKMYTNEYELGCVLDNGSGIFIKEGDNGRLASK